MIDRLIEAAAFATHLTITEEAQFVVRLDEQGFIAQGSNGNQHAQRLVPYGMFDAHNANPLIEALLSAKRDLGL